MNKNKNNPVPNFFLASAEDFKKIPGRPIAYWVSEQMLKSFSQHKKLKEICSPKSGMSSTDNDRFLRLWYEVDFNQIKVNSSSLEDAKLSKKRYFPYSKGGNFRKWHGNKIYIINYYDDGKEIKKAVVNNPKDPKTTHWSRRIFNTEFLNKRAIA
ncbi:MAG: class I SAM-dependent DNA methyltransferase, partial [Desulfobacterales bacterium]|nr:class I SAM-dependent DNA methyltransferase [Desulfobacterales bacterium]